MTTAAPPATGPEDGLAEESSTGSPCALKGSGSRYCCRLSETEKLWGAAEARGGETQVTRSEAEE